MQSDVVPPMLFHGQSPNPDRWVVEKKRLEGCSLEERREVDILIHLKHSNPSLARDTAVGKIL